MKLVSWNVNGLRSALGKGFLDYVAAEDPDVICLQETKLQPEQAVFDLPGYHRYFNSADKKGYSGTAILTKTEPLSVTYDFGGDEHRHEGRIITAEYPAFYLVCCYTPNSQDGLKRLPYRMQWEDDLRSYLRELDGKKPVVYCGDLNVAHREIDLKNPKTNRQNPGFSDQEREKMSVLLDAGFVDTFRYIHGDVTDRYSWWSYRFHARDKNVGWRIDYFIVSQRLKDKVKARTSATIFLAAITARSIWNWRFNMLKLSVNYFAKPGRREEFLRRVVEEGILTAIRREEGCLRYDYYLSCQNEDEILLLEAWDTEEHQRIHMEQEHMKRLRAIKDECIAETKLNRD